jgi:DNA-directed RNA polymerase specialized sigma24 family protein
MTEYRRQVIDLYAKGLNAAEIAARLGRTVAAIHCAISDARKAGDIVMRPGEAEVRRRASQWRAYQRDFRSPR